MDVVDWHLVGSGVAPCLGSHPILSCYGHRGNNMFFLWCIEKKHILERVETQGIQIYLKWFINVHEIERFTPMLNWAPWFHLIQVCALCHITLGWTQFDSTGLSHGVVWSSGSGRTGARRAQKDKQHVPCSVWHLSALGN